MSVLAVFLTGCTATKVTQSASGKNLDLSGYVMYGGIETSDAVTSTPTGKMIMGRVTYKSRKVGIPADQKVPTTGNFRSTKSKSLFGAEEVIIEYDWTAGSDADAKAAEEKCEELKKKAEEESVSEKKEETSDSEKKTETVAEAAEQKTEASAVDKPK